MLIEMILSSFLAYLKFLMFPVSAVLPAPTEIQNSIIARHARELKTVFSCCEILMKTKKIKAGKPVKSRALEFS